MARGGEADLALQQRTTQVGILGRVAATYRSALQLQRRRYSHATRNGPE